MKIIAFTGMPFSGKTEAVKIVSKMKIDIIRMGDLVWEEVNKRGLYFNDKNVGFVANQMRNDFGKNIWAIKTIERIKLNNNNIKKIVIDGIRSCDEVDYFKKKLGNDFLLIAINTPDNLRYKRGLKRNRKDDSNVLEKIKERDKREINWGIKNVLKCADIIVSNDKNLEDLKNKITEIFNKI